jgi:nucleoside-diphosphate-sugar epimerase
MDSKDRPALVTGATGFVGGAIVRRLLDQGRPVRALVVPGDPLARELERLAEADRNLQIASGDLTRAETLAACCEGVGEIYHTAALVHGTAPWSVFRRINVDGTRNLALAAVEAGAGRFVAVSTSDVFGIARDGRPIDETSPRGRWREPYPDTKIEAEEVVRELGRTHGLDFTVIYPGWVYGRGDRNFFPSLARAIDDGAMVFWRRHLRLAWIHVDDLARACIMAASHPSATGEGFLIHNGMQGPTLQEVCARIAATIGCRPPRLHLPYGAMLAAGWLSQQAWRLLGLRGEPLVLTNDVKSFGFQWDLRADKAREVLGWQPEIDIDEGMAEAIAWLEELRRTNQPSVATID